MQAVRDELIEHGYAEFRMERVAERANVHKTTLYRQWGSRTALVRDAIGDWQHTQIRRIDTGSWPSDLRALCRALAALERSPVTQALLRTLVVAGAFDPELTAAVHDLWEREAEVLREPIRRAQERGDVAADVDPARVIEMITGPFVQRVLVSAMAIDDACVESVARIVLAGTSTTGNDT